LIQIGKPLKNLVLIKEGPGNISFAIPDINSAKAPGFSFFGVVKAVGIVMSGFVKVAQAVALRYFTYRLNGKRQVANPIISGIVKIDRGFIGNFCCASKGIGYFLQ